MPAPRSGSESPAWTSPGSGPPWTPGRRRSSCLRSTRPTRPESWSTPPSIRPSAARSHGQLAVLWGGKAVTPAAANDQITCAVMIESAQALSNVDEIAAVPGLSMLFVGPFDLSLSLGIDTAEVAADGGPLGLIRTVADAQRPDARRLRRHGGSGRRSSARRAWSSSWWPPTWTVLRTGAASVLAALMRAARARSAPHDSVFLSHLQTKSVSAPSFVQTEPALR